MPAPKPKALHPLALEPCYVLHTRKYRDTSLILEIFGRESGRHALVAKGARGAKSRRRGQLQPFVPLLVASRGRSALKTCTQVDVRRPGFALAGAGLLLGLYANELLYKTLGQHDPAPALFDAYEALLDGLGSQAHSLMAVRRFELTLLRELGYGLDFAHEAGSGEPLSPTRRYRYVPEAGFQPSSDAPQAGDSPQASNSSQAAAGAGALGAELLKVAEGRLEEVDEPSLRRITHQAIHQLLGGKRLRSKELFKAPSASESQA